MTICIHMKLTVTNNIACYVTEGVLCAVVDRVVRRADVPNVVAKLPRRDAEEKKPPRADGNAHERARPPRPVNDLCGRGDDARTGGDDRPGLAPRRL